LQRYLDTDHEADHLNIFLEFVPGGSIASLLTKFGAFGEGKDLNAAPVGALMSPALHLLHAPCSLCFQEAALSTVGGAKKSVAVFGGVDAGDPDIYTADNEWTELPARE